MAYSKSYSYQLRFDADVSNVRKQLQSVLNDMSKMLMNNNVQLFNTEGAKAAQTEIMKLGQIIKTSFNVDTNRLDLTKFTRQLQSSGLSVEKLAEHFAVLGPDGVKTFQNIASAVLKAETPIFRLNGVMDNLWITMKNTMRWQLTSSMLHGFVGTIETAWRYAQDLNESLNSIRIVTGQSTEQMTAFAQEANKAAQELNTVTVDYTDASLIYYQQGLDAEEVKERTRITIDAANAAGTSAEQMSEYLTAVWNSYQVAVDQLENYVDKMAAVGASTATSLEEISTAMVNVASTANTVGVNMDQLTAIISTVASTTRQSASSIGTAYKTIFARMGDLKLGETLEDGLDLGSVSSQLESVGVNVLDLNGDLREMGTVVEEIGEKWQSWTTAQQTAVAQAIAGKRQYTQLIALFDNWDAYQRAFNISANAEGTLAQQAEIFGESWEAARKNVKAAAEGIYDSLINGESMVKIDKFLAKTLNYIEEFIDSIGGLGGVISTAGFIFTNVFGGQIASALRNTQNAILDLTGKQEKLNEQYRTEFVERAKMLGVPENELAIMNQRLELMQKYNSVRTRMSDKQREEFETEIQLHDFLLDRYEILYNQTKELEKQSVIYKELAQAAGNVNYDNIYNSLMANPFIDMSDRDIATRNLASEIQQRSPIAMTDEQALIAARQELARIDTQILDNIKQQHAALGVILKVSEQINTIKKMNNKEDQTGKKITEEQRQALQQLLNMFNSQASTGPVAIIEDQTRKALDKLLKSLSKRKNWSGFDEAFADIKENVVSAAQASQDAAPIYDELTNAESRMGKAATEAANAGQELGRVMTEQTLAAQSLGNNADELKKRLENIQKASADWANRMVAISQAISGISMALNSLSSIYETLEESIETGKFTFEDFRSILMSTSMVLPAMIKYSNKLAEATTAAIISAQAENAAVQGGILVKVASKGATLLLGKAELAAAEDTEILAAAQKASLGVIGLAIVAVMGLVAALDALILTQKEATESITNSINIYEQEKQKVDELTNSIESLQKQIDELNEKDSLTLTEQEDLSRLEQEIALLEQKKKLEEASERKAQAAAAREIINKGGRAASFTSNLQTRFDTGEIVWDAEGKRAELLSSKEYKDKYLTNLESVSEEIQRERMQQYDKIVSQEQAALNEYLAKNAENIQNAEEAFNIFIDAVLSGTIKATDEQIDRQIEIYRAVRLSKLGNDEEEYNEIVIKPILDDDAVNLVSDELYKVLLSAEGTAEDAEKVLNQEVIDLLHTAGISTDEFLNYLDDRLEKTKEKVKEKTKLSEEELSKLTAEDWDIISEIKLEGIDTLDNLFNAIEEHKQNEINVDVKVNDGGLSTLMEFLGKVNETEDPLEEALDNYAKQGYLTMDQVKKLLDANESYAKYIIEDANGEFKLNEAIYSDFLKIEDAEHQVLSETIQLIKDRGSLNKEYLGQYIGMYSQLQAMIEKDMSDDKPEYSYIDEQDANRIKKLAEDLQANSEAFQQGKIDIADYFDTIGNYANNRIAYGFEKLNKEIEGTTSKTDDMEIMFSAMTGEITSGLSKINELYHSGDINMDKYYDAVISGTQALLKIQSKQYNNIKLIHGEDGDYWEAKIEATKKITADMDGATRAQISNENAEIANANRAAIAQAKIANGYQETIDKAKASKGVVDALIRNYDYLIQAADNFGILKPEIAIKNNFDVTSQEFQNMCDDMSTQIFALAESDEEVMAQLVTNLRAAGAEFEGDVIESEDQLNSLIKSDMENTFAAINTTVTHSGDTIADVTAACGDLMQALGNMIQSFNYKLDFKFIGSGDSLIDAVKKVLAGEAQWQNIKLPSIEISGSDGGSGAIATFGQAIASTGETLRKYAEANLVGDDQSGMHAYGNREDRASQYNTPLNPKGISTDNYRPSDGNEGSSNSSEGSKLELKELEERYHEINALIEEQERLLEEVQTQLDRTYGAGKLKKFSEEQSRLNDLVDSEEKKMEEARNWSVSDAADLASLGLNAQFDLEGGRILNYTDLLYQARDEYNAFVEEWNSHLNDKAWQEAHESEKEFVEKLYQDRIDALKQLEDSVKTYWKTFQEYEDFLRDIEDSKLKNIAYVLEFQVDYKNAKKDVRDLSKTIAEAIGDSLHHGLQTAKIDFENMQDELGMEEDYVANFNQLLAKIDESKTNKYIDQEELANQLENLQGEVIGSAEALVEWAENLETMLPDALDAAKEKFDQFTNQLEHNTSIIDTIKEIMVLQGLTLKTARGYNDLREMYTKRMDATLAEAKLNRQWYEATLKDLEIAQTALDSATEGTQEYDILKANRDALLEQFNEAQQAMLESAKETLDTAREMYVDGVERTAYELEQVLTKGDGFDLLQDKYDHYIDTEERYLDTVNKIYETTKLNNKLQAMIDESTNSAHTKQLKELQDEFQMREANNKLSEYDIQIMNAKLTMLEKQMALEDAASNRSTLRLVRNSRGNYDYQFTANPDDLNDVNQEYLDAAQEWYNIAKDKVKETTGEIIDTWQEMTDRIKEIYEDETLTVDEREAQIAEIREYYTQKVKDLESEKQKAIVDMTEAGNIAIEDFRENHKDVLDGMTGDVNDFRDIFSEDLAQILEGSDEFNNQFAEDMDNLSEEVGRFDELFDDTINKMEDHVNEFNDTVQEVNDQAGTSYDDLKDMLDQVSDSTEELSWRGDEAAQSMREQIDAAMQASMEYANMADSVLRAAQAYRDLAAAINEARFNRLGNADDMSYDSGNSYGDAPDYSHEMSRVYQEGLANGGNFDMDEYNYWRDKRYGKESAHPNAASTSFLDSVFTAAMGGSSKAQEILNDPNFVSFDKNWQKKWSGVAFATGGYTGEFDSGKLAILHEKELVLNEDDTKNILDTVSMVRGGGNVWLDIMRTLDSTLTLFKSVLIDRLIPAIKVERDKDTLEQQVEIHAEFPSVTEASEIEEALNNVINNAAQFASQRK